MATIYNSIFPGISNGLVLNLDAGIRQSYAGTGSVWNDLSGTNDTTLTNGISFEQNNLDCRGGTLIFDGSDDYVNFFAPNLSNVATIEMWAKVSSFNNGMFIGWSTYDAYAVSGMIGYNTGNSDLYGISSTTVTNLNLLNNWIHYIFEMRSDVSYTYNKIYINGIAQTLAQQLSSEVSKSFNSGNGRISGWREGGGYHLPMRCAMFRIYNRSLNQNEININYNSIKGKSFGSYSNPFTSPIHAQNRGYPAGNYYFKSGSMNSPQLLEFQPRYYENKPFCCVFRSPVQATATTNKLNLSIPMKGLLVQRDTLDIRAAVYWNNIQVYNTTSGLTADTGYPYRKVMLGYGGGHGIYNNTQNVCSWGDSVGSVGAGYSPCGTYPDYLYHGTGQSGTPFYTNASGIWSHWTFWED